jgi:hypothetical protein
VIVYSGPHSLLSDSTGDEVQELDLEDDRQAASIECGLHHPLASGPILAVTSRACKCTRSPDFRDLPIASTRAWAQCEKKGRAPAKALPYVARGSGGRTRTYDQAVNSRPLYQLSYAGIKKRRESALATLCQYRPRLQRRSTGSESPALHL